MSTQQFLDPVFKMVKTVLGKAVSAKVSTSVTPRIIGDRSNLIRMRVGIIVSSPAAKQGTTNRTINTSLHVRDGSSAVIGGLISSHLQRGYSNQPEKQISYFKLTFIKELCHIKVSVCCFYNPFDQKLCQYWCGKNKKEI